jgi:hypothetical protein
MSVLGLLNQAITVQVKTSYGADGKEVVGSAVSERARVMYKRRNIHTAKGGLLTIDAIADLQPNTVADIDSRITYAGQTFKVHSKYPAVDGLGNVSHNIVELIRWQT